ncbi:hypothetical protein N7468_010717 [Penicillium chermesinum]|uniref:Uncharacterized protein n=1 Tax=Penicillium chermesinum TaxID=63820 RepID=A0A9W9N863_9EURO|nr:uncharacterized protein N7468_010717 [Penicillium chermesinum]KAJ5215038.1 hypothetical protein N7468_010717 [Penicillium chermesinum]
MALLSHAVLFLFVAAATTFLLPQVVGSVFGVLFRSLGWLIRRRTRSRREYVIARARSEEAEYRPPPPKASENSLARSQVDDEDWEKVDSSGGAKTAGSSDSDKTKNDATEADEWNGIIGFFHPFWYALL